MEWNKLIQYNKVASAGSSSNESIPRIEQYSEISERLKYVKALIMDAKSRFSHNHHNPQLSVYIARIDQLHTNLYTELYGNKVHTHYTHAFSIMTMIYVCCVNLIAMAYSTTGRINYNAVLMDIQSLNIVLEELTTTIKAATTAASHKHHNSYTTFYRDTNIITKEVELVELYKKISKTSLV